MLVTKARNSNGYGETMDSVTVTTSTAQWRRWGRRVFDTFFCSLDPHILPFGKENIWHVDTRLLNASSLVLSAGVGKDISFEKELVTCYQCPVLLLDPSPTGVATMTRPENHLPEIEYLQVALARMDGECDFAEPDNPAEGSFRRRHARDGDGVRFTCRSLSSLAHERNLKNIDLMKLDIEGFEYEVIDDLVASDITVLQLCVEFHHFMAHISPVKTIGAILKLQRRGYRLVHKHGTDYTFVLTRSKH